MKDLGLGATRALRLGRWIEFAAMRDPNGSGNLSPPRAVALGTGLLLAVLVTWTVARFVGLGSAPSGFYLDEQTAALQAKCVAEGGVDAMVGTRLPLFFRTPSATIHSPTWVYSAALVVKAFGASREVLRGLAAAYTLGTTLAVYGVARVLFGRVAASWSLACATMSPWAFQFSRIAWDDPLYPFWMLLGMYTLFTANRPIRAALAGMCFTLAAYSYQPGCLVSPLVLAMTLILMHRRRTLTPQLAWAAVIGAGSTSIYLAMGILNGSLLVRYRLMAPVPTVPDAGLLGHLHDAAVKWLLHFTPSFLLWKGDPNNLLLSTQRVGALSVLDVIGMLALLATLALGTLRRRIGPVSWECAYVLLGIGIAVAPAALTSDALPHQLRTIGAWPFYAIAAGAGLAELTRLASRMVAPLGVVAVAWTALFFANFFGSYPERSALWFHERDLRNAQRAAETQTWEEYVAKDPALQTPHRRYYAVAAGVRSCLETIPTVASRHGAVPPLVGQTLITMVGLGLVAWLGRRGPPDPEPARSAAEPGDGSES